VERMNLVIWELRLNGLDNPSYGIWEKLFSFVLIKFNHKMIMIIIGYLPGEIKETSMNDM